MKYRNASVCLSVLAVVLGMAVVAVAAEDKKDAAKADATGTWKWSFTTQNGETRETTAKLKQDGEKLTGTVTGRQGAEQEITDGTVKGGDIKFKVVRKIQDREVTSAYEGKIDGDTIKGKIAMSGGNQDRTRDWEAKREKDAK